MTEFAAETHARRGTPGAAAPAYYLGRPASWCVTAVVRKRQVHRPYSAMPGPARPAPAGLAAVG